MIMLGNVVFAEDDNDKEIWNITLTATGGLTLQPDFSPEQTTYTTKVSSDIGNVVVRALPTVPSTAVTINDAKVGYAADYNVPLIVGENNVVITAAAKDGRAKTYIIKINREDIRSVTSKFLKLDYVDPLTGQHMPYRLYVPDNYDSKKSYPLVLFLHGGGERGMDNEAQLTANQGATIWAKPEEQDKHPCFVLAPQARLDYDGGFAITRNFQNNMNLKKVFEISKDLKMAVKILNTVMDQYNVDKKRIYSTGVSQGGFGVWTLNKEYPDLFAAMVPICGGGDPAFASRFKTKPIWAFHAANDPIICVNYTRNMIQAIKLAGGKPRYTEYPAGTFIKPVEHFSWVLAYQDAEMRDWLFQQKQK